MDFRNILKHKYFKFGLAVFIYILFVIWLKNFWFLLGIPVIYDIYVSKKVNWSFWKTSFCSRIIRSPPLPWKQACWWATICM